MMGPKFWLGVSGMVELKRVGKMLLVLDESRNAVFLYEVWREAHVTI